MVIIGVNRIDTGVDGGCKCGLYGYRCGWWL